MKAIEALECMMDGTQVALYWPDCEMFQWIGNNAIGLFLPGYQDFAADTMTTTDFIKHYPNYEFVLYESKPKNLQ